MVRFKTGTVVGSLRSSLPPFAAIICARWKTFIAAAVRECDEEDDSDVLDDSPIYYLPEHDEYIEDHPDEWWPITLDQWGQRINE